MKNNLISLDGKKYCFDIDAIIKWCVNSNPYKEVEINESYDSNIEGELQVSSKDVREMKSNNVQNDTIKYDLLKTLINPFLGEIHDYNFFSHNFSYVMIFNTLVKMGFIIEIKD